MPTIPQYNQQVRERGALDVRVEPGGFTQVARATQGAGAAVFGVGMDIQTMNERKDRSDIQAEIAKARSDATTELQNDVQSGAINSDGYLTEFNNRLSQKLDALGGNARTRAGRELAGAQRAVLASEFATHAQTAKITADGQQMALNFDRALNDSGNTLLKDPTQYQAIREQWQAALGDPAGPYAKMSAEQKQKAALSVDKNLAKWYIQGAIEKLGPEFATKELNSGKYDSVFNADTKEMMQRRAEQEKRSREEDIQRERTLRLQQEADADRKTRLQLIQDLEKPDMGGWTFKKITQAFHDPVTAEHMRDVMKQRLAAPDQSSNPRVFLDVQSKVYLPPGNPDKITDPGVVTNLFAVNHQISHSDMIQLLRDIEVAKSQDTLGQDLQTISGYTYTAFKSSALGTSYGADMISVADSAMYRWRKDVDAKIAKVREDGGDPRQTLLNPASKDFVASPELLATYIKPAASAVAETADQMRAAAAQPVIDVKTAEDFAQVPAGRRYRAPDGVIRIKQAKVIDLSDAPIPKVPGTE